MGRIKELLKNHYYLLTAPLMYLSFPTYDVWILKAFPLIAWFCMVPLFVYVRGREKKDIYLSSFITGLVANFLSYEWIGNFAGDQTGGYTIIVIFLIPTLSVFFALKIFIAEMLSREFEKVRFIIYPLIWVLIDWVQSIGYIAFPWTNIGQSQYTFLPMVQMSSVAGILGVNFLIIITGYSISQVVYDRVFLKTAWEDMSGLWSIRRTALLVLLIAGIITGGYLVIPGEKGAVKSDLRVAMVQTCIDPWESWSQNRFKYLAELQRLTDASLRENPGLIIWSESATLETISFDFERGKLNPFQKELLESVRIGGRPLLTGEIGITEEISGMYLRRYAQNNAVLINELGEVVKTYPKIHLVPFGEWFPYEYLPIVGKPVKELANAYGGSNFVPGERPMIFSLDGISFGTLVCYEGIFYRLCREYKELGAMFLVNITNDGWTDTYRGHMQHFSASVFRAVENGLWVLRAGNTGYTAFVDPYGRVTASIPILKPGYVVGDVDFRFNHDTFYSRYGDPFQYIFIISAFLLIAAYLVRLAVKKRRREQPGQEH
ncbi:MAG: apolipoprotein N-acyltransferase [Spirochaetae bacterium HGW-Spirochaetae-1]|jgi:apolipoprotein N-acyltransferase|nr:MAG: apolipoprotein N-acyltransferase [Spirochaetae bacterium HGW-Spirochaetae-1]